MKNPCWEGYEAYGFKQKDGRRVPNCVPSTRKDMPYHLELGSAGHPFPKGKAIVVSSLTGKHHSNHPIPLASAKKQMRLLQAVEHGFVPLGQKK